MKQFATYFTHGVRNGAKLRTEIYRCHEIPPILSVVDRFFSEQINSDQTTAVQSLEPAGVA
jgi:hypothetical protein